MENPVGYSSLKLSSNESHTKNHYNFLMSEQLLQIKKGTITVCHLMSKVGFTSRCKLFQLCQHLITNITRQQ